MRESCTYGFVRGALSNERPYRDSTPRTSGRIAGQLRARNVMSTRRLKAPSLPRSLPLPFPVFSFLGAVMSDKKTDPYAIYSGSPIDTGPKPK
jgi:hypothetical protein